MKQTFQRSIYLRRHCSHSLSLFVSECVPFATSKNTKNRNNESNKITLFNIRHYYLKEHQSQTAKTLASSAAIKINCDVSKAGNRTIYNSNSYQYNGSLPSLSATDLFCSCEHEKWLSSSTTALSSLSSRSTRERKGKFLKQEHQRMNYSSGVFHHHISTTNMKTQIWRQISIHHSDEVSYMQEHTEVL